MRPRSRTSICLPGLQALAMSVAVVPGTVQAAAQSFNTALPVAEDSFVFRQQFLRIKASDDPGPADRGLTVTGVVSVLGYGVNRDVTLFAAVPYLDKELDLTTPMGQRIERDSTGFGDTRTFARYTLFQDDVQGRTFRIASYFGVETPTGDDDERDRFGRLPQPLQSGSGSWDPFGGVVATWQTLDYELDAQIAYQHNTGANSFEFGDEARLDATAQYRLWPRELGGGVPAFVYGVLESNLIHREKNDMRGRTDTDSGGTSWFLSPGLQYVSRRWVVEGIVQVPVAQDLNGSALEDDFMARAGFRINF